jgi:putative DNA primase/helicase
MPDNHPPPQTPLDAALAYARRGWPVFPCSPRDKTPLLPADRDEHGQAIRGTGGLKKATINEEQLRAWWRKWPHALPAIATGHPSLDSDGLRMFVVDFDPRTEEVVDEETGEVIETREWTLEQLKRETEEQIGDELPISLAAITPSGGVHLYLLMPDDGGPPINNRGNLPQHVDVRGLGGYVIAPPGVMAPDAVKGQGGRRYRWLRGDAGAELALAPEKLIAALRAPKARKQNNVDGDKPAAAFPAHAAPTDEPGEAAVRKYALAALDAECRTLAGTPLGNRNNQSNASGFVVGQLVGAGALSEHMARAALYGAVAGFNEPDKARTSIDNGLAAGMQPENARDLRQVAERARARSSRPSQPAGRPAPHPDEGDRFPPFQEEGMGGSGDAAPAPDEGGAGGRDVEAIRVTPDPPLDRHCGFFALTDAGNAERFRARHGHRFRFCKELGWFLWDGRRWELLSEEKDKAPGEVQYAVLQTVRAIRNEAVAIRESGVRPFADDEEPLEVVSKICEARGIRQRGLDFFIKVKGSGANAIPWFYSDQVAEHAKSSEGASRLGCISGLAKAFPGIAIDANEIDVDRMAINVLNGTLRIDVQDGVPELRLDPHDANDLISKIANVVWKPGATCPEYDKFLETVQPQAEVRRFLDQWGGISFTGDIGEQKLAFFHGKGRNGKSTLVDQWSFIAGDYGGSVPIETFLDQGRGRKGGEATPDLARLPGIRFLRTSEPEKGAKLAEALIKLVTGGEQITARHLNKGFFDFLPSFKVTVSGNHKPKITGHDDGIWRRVMLVPWDVQIAAADVDRDLPAKLRKEVSGIFNRLMAGLIDWRINGLVEPQVVTDATRKYRESSDQLGRFLADCTAELESARTKSGTLFALFTAWSKATGGAEWSQVGFSKAMEDRGYEKMHSNGSVWVGIEMTRSVDEFSEEAAPYPGERDASPPPNQPRGPQDEEDWP